MVDIEQRALRALEYDRLAGVEPLVHEPHRVRDVVRHAVAVGQIVLGDRLQIESRVLLERAERQPLGLERRDDLLLEDLLVEQVLNPNPQPGRLVGVARADPAPGGADLQLPELRLAGVVEHHVVRHDQVRVRRDPQRSRVDAPPAQLVELVGQHSRVDHHAVPDHALRPLVQDSGGDQVQLERLPAAHDRVTGVVPALKAHDGIGLLGEQVGDLSLALVAPLGSD